MSDTPEPLPELAYIFAATPLRADACARITLDATRSKQVLVWDLPSGAKLLYVTSIAALVDAERGAMVYKGWGATDLPIEDYCAKAGLTLKVITEPERRL